MILKGSQRANGADLAIHLMNGFDNERVELAQMHGSIAGDLYGAFAEFEVLAQGTKAEKYLYSLSISPPSQLTREQYFESIETIENRLGLKGQPRAVIFHVKDGREHCHVVWSRIDARTMKAIHMAHDKRKLMDCACELARKFDLDLPPGLKAWEEKQQFDKDKLEPSLAEKAQAEETGISAEERREEITACYEQADSARSFVSALEDKGYVLARGDRRGFVIVDRFGDVHSLTRYLKGHKAKEIRARLAPLSLDDLPDVERAKEIMKARRQAQKEGQAGGEDGDGEIPQESAEEHLARVRREKEEKLTRLHARRRAELQAKEQELLTRQQSERLALHAAQKSEQEGLLFRMRSAVVDLIHRMPVMRSVLGHIGRRTGLDPHEKQKLERDALDRRHGRERLDIERLKRGNARLEVREKQSLEKAVRKAAVKSEHPGIKQSKATAQQEFYDAARDQGLWRKRVFKEGELMEEFHKAGEIEPDVRRDGDDEDDNSWKRRAERYEEGRKRKRGRKPRKGRGFSRDEE